MPAAAYIRVTGRPELEAAFVELRREVVAGIKPALLDIGGNIKDSATENALNEVTNIGKPWSEFRIGATVKAVYVAPKRRRRGGSPRPNLGGLLLTAMQEALDAHKEETWTRFEALIDTAIVSSGFTTV